MNTKVFDNNTITATTNAYSAILIFALWLTRQFFSQCALIITQPKLPKHRNETERMAN